MRIVVYLTGLALLTGCAGSLTEAHRDGESLRRVSSAEASAQRCEELDDRHMVAQGVSVGFGILAGASGAMAPAIEELPKHQQGRARYAVAGTALVAGAIAASASYIAGESAESWSRECKP